MFEWIIDYIIGNKYLTAVAIFIAFYTLSEIAVFIFEKVFLRLAKKTKTELEDETHKVLFTNPYELIKIFKAVFKGDYKKHLKEVGYFSMSELEKYLADIHIE